MAIPVDMMKQFSDMMTQQMNAMQVQYEAHMKAMNEDHQKQIQVMINQIRAQGSTPPGLGTHSKTHLDSKAFMKVDKFTGEWKDWSFTFKSAVRSTNRDAFDLLSWAEKEEKDIIDVETQAPNELDDVGDIDSALFNQLAMLMKGESMQIMHNSNFSGCEAWRRLTKRYSPTTPVRGLQLMMSVVSPQKIKKGNKVLEMIERWEAKLLILERDFNEKLSDRMKAGVLLNMMPEDLQNSLTQQADKLEDFKVTKERVVSIMEAKNALNPDAMDTDNVTYEGGNDGDDDFDEDGDIGAVHKDSVCNRCGGKGHFARYCATPDPRGKGKGKGKGKDGKGGSQQPGKGGFRDPVICQYCNKKGHTAKDCWTKERDENRGKPTNNVEIECMGFEMASLEVEEAAIPCATCWQTVKPHGPYNRRGVASQPPTRNWSDRSRNRFLPLSSSFEPSGLCGTSEDKDEDKTADAATEINGLDGKSSTGKITIDSGAAENVLPRDYLPEVPLKPSLGSQRGACFIAANGSKMENLGQKRIDFMAKGGTKSNILFQVTDAKKPLASVSKIVAKGNRVVFAPDRSYIENIQSG